MNIVARIHSFVKRARLAPMLVICLLLIGCGGAERKMGTTTETKKTSERSVAFDAIAQNDQGIPGKMAEVKPEQAKVGPAGEQKVAPAARKIITTSRVELISDNFNEDKDQVETLIAGLKLPETGGYVSHREINGSTGSQRYGQWVVRLTLAQVDGFLKSISEVAELIKADSGSNDVTDQYVDLSARVSNKQKEETRLLSHLEKSATLQDTLLLEKELSRVREEVERLQGQLNVLTSATDLATITIRLQERSRYDPPPVLPPATFVETITQTFLKSYQNLIAFLQGFAILMAAMAPWLMAAVVTGGPIWLISRFVRSRTHRKTP